MAEVAKHLAKGGSFPADVQSLLYPLGTRRSKVFAYGFLFAFVACTGFLAFNSSATSSPWFGRFFTSTGSGYRHQFSSLFSCIFPDSPPFALSPSPASAANVSRNVSAAAPGVVGKASAASFAAFLEGENGTAAAPVNAENGTDATSVTGGEAERISGTPRNETTAADENRLNGTKSLARNWTRPILDNPLNVKSSSKQVSDQYYRDRRKSVTAEIPPKFSLDALRKCDIFEGQWVKDDSYPLYKEGSCPHIDEPFDCFLNGRPDREYQKLRWQPKGCSLPRLNARDMLERLRGKRLVFVGDSLNRNMWESLVCALRNSVRDKRRVFEASGRREFRTEGAYSFVFKDYNCSVEFFRSPFLVQEWEMPESNGSTKETLRLDLIERKSDKYKRADIIVFNTGHWWTHEKTSLGKDYYQEGSHVYRQLNVAEAYRKALETWGGWVDKNVDPSKTLVFFRGYSITHFNGGRWNSGGSCDRETEPIYNDAYLSAYPEKMRVLETVLSGLKTPISYLNITKMTDYRKDAHPSIYRKRFLTDEERRSPERFQDCSHWCLPGVPDSWNELLYAQLLIKLQ